MRINKLTVRNFKKFSRRVFDLHPQFTLFVGKNGSGKTSVLDALAVSMGVWLVEVPDSTLNNSRRNISPLEVRVEPVSTGDRIQFQECLPVSVSACGVIASDTGVTWVREIRTGKKRTTNQTAKRALRAVADVYEKAARNEEVLCPVLAYYGAGRAWLASNKRASRNEKKGPARRWAAFYDCFNERIRFSELNSWFERETVAAGNRGGRMRPGFEVVRRAILECVPGGDAIWFDPDRYEIVLSIKGEPQPLSNLSAGQRMMLALVADIAIKAVTQNAHLIPPDELGLDDEPLPRVLKETPGIVLIDELDVHLHPEWQRHVASDLKRTFPAIQFVCTSHSPQVIGELTPEEIRVLADDGSVTIPPRSFGIDSSRIVEELMGASARNRGVDDLLHELARLIDNEDLTKARVKLTELEGVLGVGDPEITRHQTLLDFLEETP